MTLIQFINHLKHRSISLNIFYNAKIIYLGDVGSYMHWIYKSKFDDCKIIKIEPIPTDSLNIFIDCSMICF